MIIDRLYNRFALNALATGDYIKAEKYFKKVMAMNPDKNGIHYNCAVAMIGSGNINEAETLLQKEIEISGEHFNILKTIAELYYNSGQREKALHYLKKTLKKCPDENESAILKNKIKNSSDEKTYNKCLRAMKFFENGTALLNKGDWEKARSEFIKALDLDKTNPLVYNNLGFICMMKEKKYFEARELFQKALKLSGLPIIKQNLDKIENIISRAESRTSKH